MGLTRKLSGKTWWYIWENYISDDMLFLFLSLFSFWRQGFFVVCCQEQYQPSSSGADWFQSSTTPSCKVLMICGVSFPSLAHPKSASLHSQRCESKGSRETGALISSCRMLLLWGKYSLWLLHDRVEVTQHSGSHKLLQRCSLYERWFLLVSCQTFSSERTRMPQLSRWQVLSATKEGV